MKKHLNRKKITSAILSLLVILFVLLTAFPSGSVPVSASENSNGSKTVRVGWYDSSFNSMDKFGRRSGYAYDYQQKIAAYTGWDYEYVEGSWPDLLDMLKKGEIDLMSDVSYTEERSREMLFPSFAMGAESYYLFITPDNGEIRPGQYSTLNGKKIGINKDSIQEGMFLEWEKENGINAEVVHLASTEPESLRMLVDGEIDAYLTLDTSGDISQYVPIIKIGQSEYYFAVNKNRPDLLEEVNYAMSRIQDEDRYYNQELFEKYSSAAGSNAFLMTDEISYLNENSPIKVGYINDYLPFCDRDESTGELIGALNEYLTLARDCAQNAVIDFKTIPYQTTEEALDALASGEVDCVFPVNMTPYDSEERGLLATSPVMQTEMYACVRTLDHTALSRENELTVAAKNGYLNDVLFVENAFPNWKIISFGSTEECFKAVSGKTADVTLVSSYRVARTEELREKYNFSALTTGESMEFSFAVRKNDLSLYTILNKTKNLVPVAMIEASLAEYSAPDDSTTILHFIKKNLAVLFLALFTVAVLVVLYIIRRSKRMKKEMEERFALQDKIIAKEREKLEADEMINAMSTDYRSIYYVDLDRDNAYCYRANTELKGGVREGDNFVFSERFALYARDYVSETDREGFLEFIKPENIRKALSEEALISYRYLATLNGTERFELLRMANSGHSKNAGDDVIHAVGVGFTDVDIETRKELEKNAALSDALNQAEEASAAKTAFLSSMSHEIRTPMNAIIGLNSLALTKPGLTDDVRECLEKIGASADHLLHLINSILDMSRIESGRMLIRNEEFSFRDMLEQINTMIDGQCQEKGLTYKCRIRGHVDDYYIGDDMKLKQVLLNILGNAVKYTPAPGTVSFFVEPLHEFDENASLRFIISDTGIGMDKEFLPKVFSVFSQEDENSSNKYGSTGLGMAIAKRIVEMMNGDIEVESEKGKGTTFTVTVTLRVSDKRNNSPDAAVRPQDMNVLIIDDDPEALNHAKLVMDMVGIRSDICKSGEEALEAIRIGDARHEAYDMILVDWKMPEEDGIAVTRRIREEFRDNTVIIILTAYNWEDIEREARLAGVDGFMTKPLFASNVINEFTKTISEKKSAQSEPKKADLKGKHILVAEDIEINAEIIKTILGDREIIADLAENGQIAVDMFAVSPEGNYDAILMDIRMPVLDGLKATEAIRALNRKDAGTIPIIAMTANAFDEDVQRSLQAGLNAHLTKPIEPKLLFETLESMIAD